MPALNTRQLLLAAVAVTAMGGALAQPASSAASSPSAKVPSADRKFVEKAALGGLTEVAMGKVAQRNAGSDAVKQFGAKMVEDHGKANDELKRIAGTKGITVPDDLDKSHQRDVDKFSKMNGAEFDRKYMGHMVGDHKKDISEFRKEARSGKDPEVRNFASTTLPTLQQHLKLAQDTEAQVRKSR